MRLRYLHLRNLPPLNDITVNFAPENVLMRACAIRFVVGVNGSGKTRLLQALSEIFLNLERRRPPPFPVTLFYDRTVGGQMRTILFHHADLNDSTFLIEFAAQLTERAMVDWEALAAFNYDDAALPPPEPVRQTFLAGELPASGVIGQYLPSALLAYTSGIVDSWRVLFTEAPTVAAADLPGPDDETERTAWERPHGWTVDQEIEYQRQQGNHDTANLLGDERKQQLTSEATASRMGVLITPAKLKLAVCAVTLAQAAREMADAQELERLRNQPERPETRAPGLRGLLDEVGWLWPVTLGLRIHFDPDRMTDAYNDDWIELYVLATSVVRQPEPSQERLLLFDLLSPSPDEYDQPTAAALFALLGYDPLTEAEPTAFTCFRKLDVWQRMGLLQDVTMLVRQRTAQDLLLYEWLSDGERMFLGRMALLHLLKGRSDALIILDEPETHFNDVWKRQIVDIIDDNLRDDASDVVISTHSSIALTDVFDDEITLLHRQNGETAVGRITTPTFGADPSEIMIQVFNAPDSIGKRALEYLDGLLERDWSPAQREELEQLIRTIGPGYHRSELRTVWRRLNATQD